MLRQSKAPYDVFLILFKQNNKTYNKTQIKFDWFEVKQGLSKKYPNMNELKKLIPRYSI